MYLERNVDNELFNWKNSKNRKPLMIRGARQIGKSSSIRNIGKKFTHFVEVNFDENSQFGKVFNDINSIEEICIQLEVITKIPIIEGETLLFLDEIQVSIEAIKSLRYFYEKMPNLHVIAAGSLLEFALAELPSFGVGRVRSIFMYSFSFEEFLKANNEEILIKAIQNASASKPLSSVLHEISTQYYRKFLIIGGMPEAIKTYIETQSLLSVQVVLDDLISTFQIDFTKYKSKFDSGSILQVFRAVILQIGNKFSYSYPNSTLKNEKIKEILELLRMAGLVYPITHSACNGIPLGAEINTKSRKMLIFDTGIFQRLLGLDLSDLLLSTDFEMINKGNIAELHVGLELLKNKFMYQSPELFYWQREAKGSQAEVDYVIQLNDKIVPIEVKSGKKGSMQSLYLFLKEKEFPYGIRISLENFSEIENIKIYPLYSVQNIQNNS